jgi:hypothetical protein
MTPIKTSAEFLSNIPPELRTPPLWLQYYLKTDPERPDKKPKKQPIVKWGTPVDRAANLKPLDYLLEKRKSTKHDGVQRFIDKSEGFIYIDLDHARNPETGDIEPWAVELIQGFDTYTEISASGKGFHLVLRGTLPADFHVDGNPVEVYSGNSGKLMAMTGNLYDDVLYTVVEARQEKAEQLLRKLKGASQSTAPDPAKPVQEKHWRDVFHTGSELDTTPGKVFIKGILEEGITFFGAHSGVGKTWIGLSIAHALLSQQPLFGVFPVLQRTNVLYLVPEMGGRKFRERMTKMRISMDGGFFCQTVQDGACDLEDPLLHQAVAMTRPVVILDTAIRFQAGDEQSSTQQAQGLGAKMFRLINAGAQAVICMHHRKKDLGDLTPTLANTLRGTGDFGAMADCVWCVEHARKKVKGGRYDEDYEEESRLLTRLTMTCVKPRDMEPADPFTIQGRPYINDKGDFVVIDSVAEPAQEPISKDGDEKVLALVKAEPSIGLQTIRRKTGYGIPRIERILNDHGVVKENGLWTQRTATIPPTALPQEGGSGGMGHTEDHTGMGGMAF